MSKAYSLDQIISVKSRFARSMSLVRDFESPDAWKVTSLRRSAGTCSTAFLPALGGGSSTRAWSVTGPYGTGKSSFVLFAAQLLAADSRIRDRAAHYCDSQDRTLADELSVRESPLAKKTSRLCTSW